MRRIKVGPRVLREPGTAMPEGGPRTFSLQPSGITLGAHIRGIDLRHTITAVQRAELDWALAEWKVLVFTDQHLSNAEQGAFAAQWGTLTDDQLAATAGTTVRAPASDSVVVFDRDGTVPGTENSWHTDGTFRVMPTAGTVLRAVEVPERGGDTVFADMAAAYDNLDPALRDEVDRLDAIHDWSIGYYARKYADDLDRLRARYPPVTHPVAIRHPRTGRRTLFVNPLFTTAIDGLAPAESEALLDQLFAMANLPELQFRVHWAPGTTVFWDNLAVQHYGSSDYHPQRRVMARATFFAPDVPSLQPAAR